MKMKSWTNSKQSPELGGQELVPWGYGWRQPPRLGNWPRIPLPVAGTAAAPAVDQAAAACGKRWQVWQPALGLGWGPGKAGAPQGCEHAESVGCSFQNLPVPRHPCPGLSTSAAHLGPCAPSRLPVPRGSGYGRDARGWRPKAERLGLPGPYGAVPGPAGLETGCEGWAAVLGRRGGQRSAGGWAAPS